MTAEQLFATLNLMTLPRPLAGVGLASFIALDTIEWQRVGPDPRRIRAGVAWRGRLREPSAAWPPFPRNVRRHHTIRHDPDGRESLEGPAEITPGRVREPPGAQRRPALATAPRRARTSSVATLALA